ncbi:MAG: sodium:solute symporter [Bacteroidaceae bacterium]|nr:sodium:solute symporter [Bacteroidaceae bacterium]
MIVLVTILVYFALLLGIARLTGRGNNDAFFRGNRLSPWPLVAVGMIGASVSGVTFISVPGMVLHSDMTYLQMCLGFIPGYLAVAFILLPVYYKHNLTSIYTYLDHRFGLRSYKTGASFFLLSKFTGAAARLYLVCLVLQQVVFDEMGVPYILTAIGTLLLIWLYTRQSGIKTLVWTDTLQTVCMIITILLIVIKAADMLGMDFGETVSAIWNDSHSRVFEMSDWASRQNFWKQFLSGFFIVIVMTGLDQDMMQKNLTCKNLRAAQKDMCLSGILFTPLNLLVLSMGVLMTMLYAQAGMECPQAGDNLLTNFIGQGLMGQAVLVFFTIGIIASAFSSADSAMTALTTSFCIDILNIEKKEQHRQEQMRKWVHLGMMVIFVLFLLAFKAIGNNSMIDAIYTIASYTYGPLLGLFAFGIFTRRHPRDKFVPFIAIASPVICYITEVTVKHFTGYTFGYEMLMLNGALTFLGLSVVCCPLSVVYKNKEK